MRSLLSMSDPPTSGAGSLFRTFYDHSPVTGRSRSTDEKNRIYAWDWNSFRVKTIADFTKVLRMTWDFCVTLSFCVYENKNYEKDDLPVAPLSMRNLMVKYAKLFPPNIAMHCWQKSEVRLPKLAKILTFQWLQCQKLLEVVLEEASSRKIKE